MKRFKYQDEIEEISCDLKDFREYESRKCYRWVYESIDDERNFLPVFLRNPERKRDDCKGWSLSMYETQEQARNRLRTLVTDKNKLHLKLGTHTAEGELGPDDGQSNTASTKSQNAGHFDHFEYINSTISSDGRFSIVECVITVQDE